MKRHKKLILMILRYAEENATGKPLPAPRYEEYSRIEVLYHIDLCHQAGYLEIQKSGKNLKILNLTWNGQEELERNLD